VTATLVLALIALWLIAVIQVGAIERDCDLADAMTRLRIQRRRELRESLSDRR
jgi:hypothetical protein